MLFGFCRSSSIFFFKPSKNRSPDLSFMLENGIVPSPNVLMYFLVILCDLGIRIPPASANSPSSNLEEESVWHRPPARSDPSKTVTFTPAFFSSRAAARPARPAPITTAVVEDSEDLFLGISRPSIIAVYAAISLDEMIGCIGGLDAPRFGLFIWYYVINYGEQLSSLLLNQRIEVLAIK
mmetsp:Transcript_24366/g.37057  ORF Transcript_24366/g.37057 Transcript_24366/m.37057 type:complete len:180 (-) Transcript_24366:22-561(-)